MTGKEILEQEFEKSGMRGYRADQVDVFLQKVAVFVDEQENEKNDLIYKMQILADKIEEYKKDEENIREALLGAQKLGSSIVNEAKAKAETLTREAKSAAEEMMLQAKTKVDTMTKESLQKANLELGTLRHECDMEQRHLETIKQEVSSFRASLLKQYKQHLDLLANLPTLEEPEESKPGASYFHSAAEPLSETGGKEPLTSDLFAKEEPSPSAEEETPEVKPQTISSGILSEEDIAEEEKEHTKEFGQEKAETPSEGEHAQEEKDSEPPKRRSSRPNYIEKFGELKFGGFNDSDKK